MNRGWALVFAASGGLLLVYGVGLVREARTARTWSHTTGRIIRAEAEVIGREKNKTTYAPAVGYVYEVAGQRHEGSRLTFVPQNTISPAQVRAWLAPYPTGGEVRVYYDPRNPASSVLVPTTNGTEWAYAVGGGALLALGVWMLTRGAR